jgi:hypothetical protein
VIHVHSYDGVCKILAQRFATAYDRRRSANIVGLIFSIADTPLAKSELLPIIDYWHHRSDNVTDFLCAGFGEWIDGDPSTPRDASRTSEIKHAAWSFSSEALVKFTMEVEARSNWRPQADFEIILCVTRYDAQRREASLDFSSAIVIPLQAAKKAGAVQSLWELLNMTFVFAQSVNESDPTWRFSDDRGLSVLTHSLEDLWKSWLPKWLAGAATKAKFFAVHDISK